MRLLLDRVKLFLFAQNGVKKRCMDDGIKEDEEATAANRPVYRRMTTNEIGEWCEYNKQFWNGVIKTEKKCYIFPSANNICGVGVLWCQQNAMKKEYCNRKGDFFAIIKYYFVCECTLNTHKQVDVYVYARHKWYTMWVNGEVDGWAIVFNTTC